MSHKLISDLAVALSNEQPTTCVVEKLHRLIQDDLFSVGFESTGKTLVPRHPSESRPLKGQHRLELRWQIRDQLSGMVFEVAIGCHVPKKTAQSRGWSFWVQANTVDRPGAKPSTVVLSVLQNLSSSFTDCASEHFSETQYNRRGDVVVQTPPVLFTNFLRRFTALLSTELAP